MTVTTARPTRRTLVRGAAWSVPVVSIAAAAPAFASSLTPSSGFSGDSPVKWGSGGPTKHVSWDLTLTVGPVAIETIEIKFTYVPNGGGSFTAFQIYGFSPATDNTWSFPPLPGGGSPTVTASHGGYAAGNTPVVIHTDFAGADASGGKVTAVATIKYVGVPGTVTKTLADVPWGQGDPHVGH